MDNFELRKQALEREQDRAIRIAAAVDGLPKRKQGEAKNLRKLIDQMHATLCSYDQLADPPAIAGVTETWFDTAIERLKQIKAEAKQVK